MKDEVKKRKSKSEKRENMRETMKDWTWTSGGRRRREPREGLDEDKDVRKRTTTRDARRIG
jgi:hypothetical protein